MAQKLARAPLAGVDGAPRRPEAPAASEGRPAADRGRLGRRARRKGKVWEREVAAMLRPVFGPAVARGFQSRSGRDGCDVEGTPFWVEAKHQQLVDLRAAVRQGLADSDGRTVVVVAKDDRKPPGWAVGQPGAAPLAVMLLSDWLELAGRAHAGRPGGASELLVDAAAVLRGLGQHLAAEAVEAIWRTLGPQTSDPRALARVHEEATRESA